MVEELASGQATEYQPQAIIKYLQARIEWIAATDNGQNPNLPVETTANTDGEPQQILCMHFSIFSPPICTYNKILVSIDFFSLTDATKISGILLMWIQWPNGNTKYVEAKVANKKWPSLVIRYYESHIHLIAAQ